MTTEEAIAEETRRYVKACRLAAALIEADPAGRKLAPAVVRHAMKTAHRHALTIKRLRHYAVTEHESLKLTAGC